MTSAPAVRARRLFVAEALASAAAVALIPVTALHWFGVYLCFGQCPGPSEAEIRDHALIVAALALAVVLALGFAVARRARWQVHVWHVAVAVAAVGTAIVCSVPQIDPRRVHDSEPVRPDPGYVPCYSGSNDCPGG